MLNKETHGESGSLVVELVDEVLRLRGRIVAATKHLTDGTDVRGMVHGLVLNAVVCALEPPTVPRIARSLGYARQVVQRAADELEQDGLIALQDNPHHKKAMCLVATEKGQTAYAQTDKASVAWTDRLSEQLGHDSLQQIVESLRHVRRVIEHDMATDETRAEE